MTLFQVVGIIGGLSAGLIWERLATMRFGHFRTLVPSLFVREGGSTWHIHHWLAYAIILVILIIVAYKTDRLMHPAVMFLGSAILTAIVFNFIVFNDWHTFLVARPK